MMQNFQKVTNFNKIILCFVFCRNTFLHQLNPLNLRTLAAKKRHRFC